MPARLRNLGSMRTAQDTTEYERRTALVGERDSQRHRRLWALTAAIVAAALIAGQQTAHGDGKVILLPDEPVVAGKAAAPEGELNQDRIRHIVSISLERGALFLEQSRFAEAKAEMEKVLRAEPGNEQARRMLAVADGELARFAAATQPPAANETINGNRLEMETRYYQANRLISESRYEEAIPKLQMAIAIGENLEGCDDFTAGARKLLSRAEAHQFAQMSDEAVAAREEASAAVNAFETSQRLRENEKIETLFERSKRYYLMKEYTKAHEEVAKVLEIDPRHEAARELNRRIETDGRRELAADAAERRRRSYEAEFDRIREAQTPQTELVRHPEQPARHETVSHNIPEQDLGGPAIDAIEKALGTRISCDFNGAGLVDAVSYLRKATGCNIVVDPRCANTNESVGRLATSEMEMLYVLNQLCRMNRLKWKVKDEMIIVSDRQFEEDSIMEVYDVADLCMEPRSFSAIDFREVDGRRTGNEDQRLNSSEESYLQREERGKELVGLIRHTVDPWSWDEDAVGHAQNTIQFRGGKVIVKNNPEVHKKIMRLLEAFRRARAVQVSIQTRFIEINKDFLERAGVDWNGLDNLVTRGVHSGTQTLPAGAAWLGDQRLDEFGNPVVLAPWYRDDTPTAGAVNQFGPTRGTPNEMPSFTSATTFGRRPWPALNTDDGGQRPGGYLDLRGRNVNISPVNLPGLAEGWTNYGGLFLDIALLTKYQVRALVEAVRKQKHGNMLTSPRVTCFNGQRANIVVATLHNYIKTYDDTGTPEIATATDGVVLEVKPYVSADQHYVTLELLPSISIVTFPDEPMWVTRAFITTEDRMSSGMIPIETPEVEIRAVETTVSVPDGGTILIGGLSRANESEGYASVPLLCKIPVIKYLFTSWGRLDRRESLVILVSANILVQSELEPQLATSD